MATKKVKATRGAKLAEEMRAGANKLSDDQRDGAMSTAMQLIYGKVKKSTSHAVRD